LSNNQLNKLLRISEFLKKYDSIVKMTTYSEVLSDIDNGIQSLAELVNFFSENINGSNENNYNFVKFN
jgi:hypothetical protein